MCVPLCPPLVPHGCGWPLLRPLPAEMDFRNEVSAVVKVEAHSRLRSDQCVRLFIGAARINHTHITPTRPPLLPPAAAAAATSFAPIPFTQHVLCCALSCIICITLQVSPWPGLACHVIVPWPGRPGFMPRQRPVHFSHTLHMLCNCRRSSSWQHDCITFLVSTWPLARHSHLASDTQAHCCACCCVSCMVHPQPQPHQSADG